VSCREPADARVMAGTSKTCGGLAGGWTPEIVGCNGVIPRHSVANGCPLARFCGFESRMCL
jgi:hypothetical protein